MSPHLLEQGVSRLKRAGRRVPAVVPVDLFGRCADYTAIGAIADAAGMRVLADAAESLGASHGGRAAGSLGTASVVSFNGNKIMTTSGGGMLLTDDERLCEHVRKLSTQAREPVVHYEHTEVGYNYRLSNILAALGRAQLTRLDEMVKRRRVWRDAYHAMLAGVAGVRVLGGSDDAEDNCWLTPVVVDPDVAPFVASDLAAALQEADIESRPLWKPMHLQPVCAGLDGAIDGTSERLFDHGLTLPGGSAMSEQDFARVEAVVRRVVGT